MHFSPHTTLLCPHCFREFRVAAWRIIPGAAVSCTCCSGVIEINERVPEHRSAITGARTVSESFQQRLRGYRLSPQPRPTSEDPVLTRLQEIAARLDQLASRR